MKRIVRLRSVKDFKKVLLPKQTHPSEQPEPATAGDDIHRLQTQLEDISAKLVELKTGGIN